MATAASSITFLGKNIYNRNEGVKETPCTSFFREKHLSQKCSAESLCLLGQSMGQMDWDCYVWCSLRFPGKWTKQNHYFVTNEKGELSVKWAISNGHRKPKKYLIKYRNMMDQFAKVLYLCIYLSIHLETWYFSSTSLNPYNCIII